MGTTRSRTAYPLVGFAAVVATIVAVLVWATTSSPVGAVPGAASWSPLSVSLLRTGAGWALARHDCATGTCISLWRTTDRATTWRSISLPSRLRHVVDTTSPPDASFAPLSVSFVNAHDGLIYGSRQPRATNTGAYEPPTVELWSTHDGGVTWTSMPTRSLGIRFDVLAVDANRGSIYAIGWDSSQRLGLWRSPVSTNAWRRVSTPPLLPAAGGTSMEAALVFNGTSGWLLVGNDRGVTGSARMTRAGRWVSWSSPCATIGDDFAVPVVYSPSTLVDVCQVGGYGGSVAPSTPSRVRVGTDWLVRSRNGGLSFTPARQVGVEGRTQWLEQVPGLPASPEPGVLFVARAIERAPTQTVEHLLASRDGGRTWTSVYIARSELMGALQLVSFASAKLGVAINEESPTISSLVVTNDGGRTWRRVAL